MVLLNPKHLDRPYPDARSSEIMRKTVDFFEAKGKTKLLQDYYDHPWYADFLEFVRKERIFASMCTPAGGAPKDPTDVAPDIASTTRLRCGFVSWRPPANGGNSATMIRPSC